jgi:hypothetical protein
VAGEAGLAYGLGLRATRTHSLRPSLCGATSGLCRGLPGLLAHRPRDTRATTWG